MNSREIIIIVVLVFIIGIVIAIFAIQNKAEADKLAKANLAATRAGTNPNQNGISSNFNIAGITGTFNIPVK